MKPLLNSPRICCMGKVKDDIPEYARAIAARRAYLGKSGMDIENEHPGVLYQKLISHIETGKKTPGEISVNQWNALLQSLDWSPREFLENTGFDVPHDVMLPTSFEYENSLYLPVLGPVSAGLQTISQGGNVSDFMPIDPSLPGIKGRPKLRLAWLWVNGDSMLSPEASKSIPDGSMVVFEWGAVAENKDIVIAWIEELETAVIKQFSEGSDIILSSYNSNGPVFRASQYHMDIRGIVRLILRKPH